MKIKVNVCSAILIRFFMFCAYYRPNAHISGVRLQEHWSYGFFFNLCVVNLVPIDLDVNTLSVQH